MAAEISTSSDGPKRHLSFNEAAAQWPRKWSFSLLYIYK